MATTDGERAATADCEAVQEDQQPQSGQETLSDAGPATPASGADLPPTQISPGSSPRKSDASAADTLASLLSQPDSTIALDIDRLGKERDTLKKQKKRVSNEIRNEERKRARLRQRARLLSSNDLLEVFAMRNREQKKREDRREADE